MKELSLPTIAAGLFAATLAGAQPAKQFVITPYVGLYAPTTSLLSESAALMGVSANASLRQQPAFAFGANASYWLNDRVAFELGGAYSASDLKSSFALSDPSQLLAGSVTENARVIMGSAKVVLALLPTTNKVNLRLGIGPAIVNRSGSAFKSDEVQLKGLTTVGGALSLCTKIPLTNVLAVRVRAEDYMYQSKLKLRDRANPADEFSFNRKFQSDLLFSAGLQISLYR